MFCLSLDIGIFQYPMSQGCHQPCLLFNFYHNFKYLHQNFLAPILIGPDSYDLSSLALSQPFHNFFLSSTILLLFALLHPLFHPWHLLIRFIIFSLDLSLLLSLVSFVTAVLWPLLLKNVFFNC